MASPQERQRIHQGVLRHFMKTGRAPHYTEIAETMGVDPEQARRLVRETTVESPFSFAWLVPETDYIASWAPFSSIPNHNLISVDGIQKWYGQWGLEALAVCQLFPGSEITLDTRCLQSGDPIRVRMRGPDVLEVSPEQAIGYASTPVDQWGQPNWANTWARMNLFRSEESVRAWADFDARTAKQIKSVKDWAQMFRNGRIFQKRLEDDFVEKSEAYAGELLGALGTAFD